MIEELNQFIQKTITHLKEELKAIRTGRANPSLIEMLQVSVYGGSAKMKLMEIATISSETPSSLLVSPFDPSTVPDIEKAIMTSPLGISPQIQGNAIRVNLPPLTQEQREKILKVVGGIVEETKEQIRRKRDEVRKKIKKKFDDKEMSEDERYKIEKEIDAVTSKRMEEIQTVKEVKEKDIMHV